ncbi:M23 family metallopeptidase [Phenylobacterium immobile]|uniref:M23 family metallopeptidase n=1 Tax=Phenylobacterium immobile TaxID=21 RepID=UPI000B1E655A|nr:M23 family metallopeptidase [Phenylobacterium immobile]
MSRFARLRARLEAWFPERHIYVRSGGQMKGLVLTPGRQLAVAGVAAGAAMWMGVCTAAMLVSMMSASAAERDAVRTQAKYERWIADRQARLNAAVTQLNAASGSSVDLAENVEKRHAALALLLTELKGAPGAAEALTPTISRALAAGQNAAPARRLELVRLSQEELLEAADGFAKSRAERLRLVFRMAGLTPSAYMPRGSLGGPLIEAKDSRALAAVLDIDEDFAARIQNAARDMSETQAMAAASQRLPFERPTHGAQQTSGFGVRSDPFTRRPALHSGLDFAGATMTPIYVTGPGVVSFTGVRSGYGATIEVDHGSGFKTRYAHLKAINVRPGQRVALGQRIGGMGSTGRSTGTHLHYEIWVNGRAQNPVRFVRAGDMLG